MPKVQPTTAAPAAATCLPPADLRAGLDITVDRKALRQLLAGVPGGARKEPPCTRPAEQTAVVLHALGHRDVVLRARSNSPEVGRRLDPARFTHTKAGSCRLPVHVLKKLCDKLTDDRIRIQSVPAGKASRLLITTGNARFELDQAPWQAELGLISPEAAPSPVAYDPAAAARKAWVTRLSRPDFDPSAAARKAWVTRRRQQQEARP